MRRNIHWERFTDPIVVVVVVVVVFAVVVVVFAVVVVVLTDVFKSDNNSLVCFHVANLHMGVQNMSFASIR